MTFKGSLGALTAQFARDGRIEWIGVRPERGADMDVLPQATVTETGLVGDRRATPGKRAVTLIQAEHLAVIAALAGLDDVPPHLLRRNLVVSGINLLGLRNRRFAIGPVVLEGTGLCAPCSKMEIALGRGGYTAMRGHGGITAQVVEGGNIDLGSAVTPVDEPATA